MEYAIVRFGGKQYKVSKGDILEVDRQNVELNGQVVLDDVLLFVSDGKIKIGKPKVANVKVKAKVLEHKKGEKIRVAKFKAKVRYRRVTGFRPSLTRLQIEDIESP
jgi:large subunit ribosomal protein L21